MTHVIPTFPLSRPRRLRREAFLRDLVRETTLMPEDLILPMFVRDDISHPEPIASMPGVFRYPEDALMATAHQASELGIRAVAIFPVIPAAAKSVDGREAYNPDSLVPRVLRRLRRELPELGRIADVALDPYTTHGHDGLVGEDGHILNDETVAVLRQQAVCLAEAGASIVAPSDMMDGRVRGLREGLDAAGYGHVAILAYAAKYASRFYGPFRTAVGSAAHLAGKGKETYQMDPANAQEALREVAMDLDEGADMVMVKPGMPYLDIVSRIAAAFQVPTLVYQVSGEYAMLKAAAQAGWLDEQACVLESLLACKRAGACGILTYYALDAARWLREGSAS